MTEPEWQNASEPQAMLGFLLKSGGTSERKLRLFAVACSRRVWTLIDPLGRYAVEVAERFADRLAGPVELRDARLACQGAGDQASWYAAATIPENAARNAALSAQVGVARLGSESAELLAQTALVRDVFGNPFRPSSLDQSCRTPHVIALAQVIYDARAFNRMLEFAEALEKAGCDDAVILGHCRGAGQHVRGCFVIDLVLGKE